MNASLYWKVFALITLCSARVQALHDDKTQRPLPHAAQHTQHKSGVTRTLTLPVQHVPALSPHSKLPSDRGRIARSTWFDFPAFCVGVLPCPAGGLVHTDARRKSREIHQKTSNKSITVHVPRKPHCVVWKTASPQCPISPF